MKFGVAAAPLVSSPHVPRNCPWNFCVVVMGAPPWIIECIFLQWSAIWLNGRGRWELFPIAPVLFSRDRPSCGGQLGRWRTGCGRAATFIIITRRLRLSPPSSFLLSCFSLRPSIAHAPLSASPVILCAPSPYLRLRLPEGFHLISPLTEM